MGDPARGRLRRRCDSVACRGVRSCGPARAASSTATCCIARAWCRTQGSAQTRSPSYCLFGRGSGRTDAPRYLSSATSLTSFRRDRRSVLGAGRALHVLRTARASGSFLRVSGSCAGRAARASEARRISPSRTGGRASRGTPACPRAGRQCRTARGTARVPSRPPPDRVSRSRPDRRLRRSQRLPGPFANARAVSTAVGQDIGRPAARGRRCRARSPPRRARDGP